MLQRQFRLPAKTRLLSSRSIYFSLFTLKVSKNTLELSRFGFVIGKVVDKQAVVRNRTKRIIRSVVEDTLTTIAPGYDLLFLLKKPVEGRTKEVEEEVLSALRKAGVFLD